MSSAESADPAGRAYLRLVPQRIARLTALDPAGRAAAQAAPAGALFRFHGVELEGSALPVAGTLRVGIDADGAWQVDLHLDGAPGAERVEGAGTTSAATAWRQLLRLIFRP